LGLHRLDCLQVLNVSHREKVTALQKPHACNDIKYRSGV
jgi:hypothetical protein